MKTYPHKTCIWLYIATLLEKAMAPHSSTVARKIPWMEEPGRLQSMGSLRVRHDWATSLSLSTFMHWRRKWQPTPVFCLENPMDGEAWWAAVHGVAHSQTWLKWLGGSSSSNFICIATKLEQPKCPSIDEWLNKLWYIYTMGLKEAYQGKSNKKELLIHVTTWIIPKCWV